MVSAGAWLFIVPGMFVDRFGPKSTALIGVSMIATGYIALALAANQTISINYGAALFLGFLLGHGSAWTQAAALVTSASNTSSARRGAVLGLLQANYSLSSGYYTQVH
jgi:MFS family permease